MVGCILRRRVERAVDAMEHLPGLGVDCGLIDVAGAPFRDGDNPDGFRRDARQWKVGTSGEGRTGEIGGFREGHLQAVCVEVSGKGLRDRILDIRGGTSKACFRAQQGGLLQLGVDGEQRAPKKSSSEKKADGKQEEK